MFALLGAAVCNHPTLLTRAIIANTAESAMSVVCTLACDSWLAMA